MAGWWNLSAPLAMLAIGLPEGACSHMFRSPLLRRAYPNGRTVEPVSSARGAGNRPARRHMLAHVLPVAPAEDAPE